MPTGDDTWTTHGVARGETERRGTTRRVSRASTRSCRAWTRSPIEGRLTSSVAEPGARSSTPAATATPCRATWRFPTGRCPGRTARGTRRSGSPRVACSVTFRTRGCTRRGGRRTSFVDLFVDAPRGSTRTFETRRTPRKTWTRRARAGIWVPGCGIFDGYTRVWCASVRTSTRTACVGRRLGSASVLRVSPERDVEELSAGADAEGRIAVLERHQARSGADRVRREHALARHLRRRGGEPAGGGVRTAGIARPGHARDDAAACRSRRGRRKSRRRSPRRRTRRRASPGTRRRARRFLAQLPARETLVGFRVREAPGAPGGIARAPRGGVHRRRPRASERTSTAYANRSATPTATRVLGLRSSSSRRRGDDGDGFEAARECVDWLGLTATGAKPGTPAAAARGGAVAIEAHKLAAVKASRLRDEEEKVYGVVEGETVFARRPFRHTCTPVSGIGARASAPAVRRWTLKWQRREKATFGGPCGTSWRWTARTG